MTPEQKKAIAIARARARAKSGGDDPSGFMAFANRGISQVLGAPGDVVNMATEAVGLGSPLPGASGQEEAFRQGLGAETVPRRGERAENVGQRAGLAFGQGAATLPILGATGAAVGPGARGVAAGAGRMIGQPFVRNPVGATATELAASAGAGAGGYIAEENAPAGYEDMARGVGEIVGGIGTGLATQAVGLAESLPRTALLRGLRASMTPWTKGGAEVRASRRVQELAGDLEAAVGAIDAENPGNLTPAQQTGDERLMALERSILDEDAALSDEFAQRSRESTEALRSAVMEPAGGATGMDARQAIEARRKYGLALLDQRLDQAIARADQRLSELSPARRETDNATILRQEVERAYEDARAQESELWAAVPQDAMVPTGSMKARFDEISAETGRARRGDIPQDARNLLDGDDAFSDMETVQEVHDFYSRMRQIAREARAGAAPNRNRARIADRLADAALEDLGARAQTPDEVGRTINAARVFSADMNETFTQGEIGKLLGTRREGGDAIAPERTAEFLLGRGGSRAVVSVEELRRAVGPGNPAAGDAATDYLKRRFNEFAAPRGGLNPARGRDFMRQNAELLERFPELRRQMDDAVSAREGADATSSRTEGRTKALRDPRQSAGAALERSRFGEEFSSVVTAQNPARAARSLRASAAKDPTGQALRGLKGAALDYVMNSARSVTPDGDEVFSGGKMLDALQNDRTRGALNEVLDRGDMQRLQRLAREFSKLERSRGRLPDVGPVMDDATGSFLNVAARVLGARAGAAAGGASMAGGLQSAQIFAGRADRFIRWLTKDRAERLLRDAIQDPELMKALLSKPDTKAKREMIRRNLLSWAGSLAVDTEQPE